ncbi:MAG: hypothetical protein PHE78_04600 [Candidatus Gastranaerophilales bacterium]|nr:hypothetical protein [Candidatus Gastranaerophilales bacterium]
MKNTIDFYLRNLFKFSRKGYREKSESKSALFYDEKITYKEQILLKKYKLYKFKESSTKQTYLENLYILELLEDYLKPERKNALSVLDIGSKNWSYAKAEHAFFAKFIRHVEFWKRESDAKTYIKKEQGLTLDGIEVDAHRVYADFYSRKNAAEYYIQDLKGANYIVGDLMDHQGEYDFIVWVLPFVLERPHSLWGLPKKLFKPKEMLQKAYNSLKDGGTMLIVNQGQDEYEMQQKLFDEAQIIYMPCGEFKSSFLKYKNKRFVSLITRMN